MNRSIPLPSVSFLRTRQPSLAELEHLLDFIPQASLLVDLEKNSIVLANAKATELTAFTRSELIKSNIENLIPFLSNHLKTGSTSSKPETYIDSLATRQGSSIEVRVEITRFDPLGSWGLVTFEPANLREKSAAELKRRSERLSDLSDLILASYEKDVERALQKVLESGKKMTGADFIALYLAHGTKPGLERKFTSGLIPSIPEKLEPSEINEYLKPTTWEPGNRVSNHLFRAAKISKMGYLQTYPIGEDGAFLGIVVLAAEQGGIPAENTAITQILSGVISGVIQQNSVFANLLNRERIMGQKILIGDTVQESTQDGIILLSPDLLIEELNPQAEALLGYASTEIYGQPVNNVLIGPLNLVPALQSAQQGISTPNLGEVHLHRRDGVAFLAHLQVIPLMSDEDIQGIIVMLRDLSAHEESEIRNQQLEQRALLGEVTAIFAHEVRNPINNISTGLQLMAFNLPSDDPNQEVITRLLDDCNRLNHLMQSVLTFSRPPENKFQQVDLAELIPTLLERWRPRLARLKVEHEFVSKTKTTTILGDPRALEQVFSNLIGNAVEAMKSNGGKLSIHIRQSHQEGGRQYIEVNVIDDGPGIPPDLIDRIFEPFVTTSRNGTGLGLSIAKRIVSAHKGTISASSVPGGTVFQVTLPQFQNPEV
ncbi:MAG: PAS domain-containing protein [Chloroflexota bacterium]|nr:MAG: PAS domain-containing protein [Chloroflexota bacterium]